MVTFYCHSVCPIGSYLNANSNGACQVCPENTYGTATNTASCNSCPNGETTRGQTEQTDVSACGKYLREKIKHAGLRQVFDGNI